jgi:Fe-S-cluster containining protein
MFFSKWKGDCVSSTLPNKKPLLIENPCQACRSCCKFKPGDAYFATLFTSEDIENIKRRGLYKDVFVPYKKSLTIFQIKLIPSLLPGSLLVCPYLNEETHLCSIYDIRPFDCRFWPFIFMFDKQKEKAFWSCFHKDFCDISDQKSDFEFSHQIKASYNEWLENKGALDFLCQYPEIIWDFEPDTFTVKEIENFPGDKALPSWRIRL